MSILPVCVVLSAFFLIGSSAEECLCAQNLIILPVCGDDGRTYVNSGAVECYNKCNNANVKVLKKQPCPCNCPTNRSYFPVCANNGKSYINLSAVDCHNKCNYPPIEIVTDEPCNEDDELLSN